MATCDYHVKLVMLGNSGVGKTSIVTRFNKSTFPEAVRSTIYTDFIFKNVVLDNKILRAQVWDTAGQERYRVVTSAYYREAAGVLLVYDITDLKSFQDIDSWLGELQGFLELNALELVLLGNKTDRDRERKVTTLQGQELAAQHGFTFFETSAKSGFNIDEAFTSLLGQVYHKKIKVAQNSPSGLPAGVKGTGRTMSVLRKKEQKKQGINTLEEFQAALHTCVPQVEIPLAQKSIVLLRNFISDPVFPSIANHFPDGLLELYIGANVMTFIPDLTRFRQLRVLHINNNNITSLSTVLGLQSLEQLDLRSNKIASLSGFPHLPALTWLSLSCNSLTSLSGLNLCPSLDFLGLFGNYLGTDSAALQSSLQLLSDMCPRLTKTYLAGNGWDDIPDYREIILRRLRLELLDGERCG